MAKNHLGDNAETQQDEESKMPGEGQGRRSTVPLLIIAIAASLVLLGVVVVQRFLAPDLSTAEPTPTITPEPGPSVAPPQAVQVTPTPTRVIAEAAPTSTATPSPSPAPAATERVPEMVLVSVPSIVDLVRNGSFETGFENHSLGLGWESFTNGSAIFEFLDETWPPAVLDGQHAQRIQVREATQANRYAGIYQTVDVLPGERYDLSLHGQIRSDEGDITISQYGYRMQLGIDYQGGRDWTAIDNWIELPWDEQRFDSEFLFFYDYNTSVLATGPHLTLFIRTWTKWADPRRVEYTLDAISLKGPALSEEIALDKPLPLTGEAPSSISGRVRALASAMVLFLLIAGAVWHVRRQIG